MVVGDTATIHDPSIFFQNGTYYLFSTDPSNPEEGHHLPIRCSEDKIGWRACGEVLTAIPGWVTKEVRGLKGLWAPDVSYFNGLYHVYYCGSLLHTQISVIGLATNTTLDPSSPDYRWVDRGKVIASKKGDDFNALDPNILVDSDERVWLTYGSYWTGIKQREIDAKTGMLLATDAARYELARRPGVPDDAIEGASLVRHEGYYYLFLSVDHCCESEMAKNNYKQVVGRSPSPHGPFADVAGVSLMEGGASILIEGNKSWAAPGGGTVYLNQESGDSMIVFHALDMSRGADASLWIKGVGWKDDWPILIDGME